MPGLTAWLPARADSLNSARFRDAQRLMARGANDAAVVDVESPHCLIGHVGYPGYPVRVLVEPDFTVVFEGHAYGRSEHELRRDVVDLFRRALRVADALELVSAFVRATDGDFLAVAASPDRCIAFGDALGRLPVYVQQGSTGLAFARECKFVAAINEDWSFDRLGLAQHLWLGYPLGQRTLFEGIERADEGFFLDARANGTRFETRRGRTYEFRCDVKSDSRGLDASAEDLAARILRATEARANVEPSLPPIVSLSGGHDSRSILAGVWRARPDCIAATFQRTNGGQADDVRVAQQVAHSLGVHWECVELPSIDAEAEERLIWMKDGLNYSAMAFIVAFFDELVRRWSDRAVLLTGDGGDKIFPDLRPVRRARNLDGLVEILVDESALMPAGEIEPVLGLPPGSLVDELRARLARYPERELEQKAVHWKIAERSRKWLCEGEDRNRCFLWQASPCFALPVFEAAMRVPDELKTDLRFYAQVQRHLDPALLRLPHADTGMVIDSPRYRARAVARRWALRAIGSMRRPLLRRLKAAEPDPGALREDTLSRLDSATRGGSRLMQAVRTDRGRANVAHATRNGLHNWRTALLVDRLWTERIPAWAGPSDLS